VPEVEPLPSGRAHRSGAGFAVDVEHPGAGRQEAQALPYADRTARRSRYKARLVENDRHIRRLVAWVHLNFVQDATQGLGVSLKALSGRQQAVAEAMGKGAKRATRWVMRASARRRADPDFAALLERLDATLAWSTVSPAGRHGCQEGRTRLLAGAALELGLGDVDREQLAVEGLLVELGDRVIRL